MKLDIPDRLNPLVCRAMDIVHRLLQCRQFGFFALGPSPLAFRTALFSDLHRVLHDPASIGPADQFEAVHVVDAGQIKLLQRAAHRTESRKTKSEVFVRPADDLDYLALEPLFEDSESSVPALLRDQGLKLRLRQWLHRQAIQALGFGAKGGKTLGACACLGLLTILPATKASDNPPKNRTRISCLYVHCITPATLKPLVILTIALYNT